MSPLLGTVISTIVGIFVSVLTAMITHRLKTIQDSNAQYRKEREEKEKIEQAKRELEHQSLSKLTLGMARSMLLQNYYKAMDRGAYPVQDREVYHELFVAYESAGGDGVIHDLSQKIVELPTEPPKD